MKKILLGLVLLSAYGNAQNGLQNVIVEPYYISSENDTIANIDGGTLPIKSTTYRIYVDMLPGYKFQAAYGVNTLGGEHELRLATTTTFFNNVDRGDSYPAFNKSYEDDNTLMVDSWLSCGAACAGSFGVLKSADNGVSTIVNSYVPKVLQDSNAWMGIPIRNQDGIITTTITPEPVTDVNISTEVAVFGDGSTVGSVFSTYNGSWASLNGSVGLDTSNIVLIAQITTDGNFAYQLNIQIGTPSGGTQQYVSKNAVGSEILCAFCMDSLIVPNYSPTVTVTAPVSGTTVTAGNVVNITATAGDLDGSIDSVQFYIDANYIGSDLSSPYQINWTSVVGTHSITAIAYDDMSAQATSSVVTITVTTGGGSGIEENSSAPVITLYPNPVSDFVNIEITATQPSKSNHYAIYNIQGEVMYRKQYREIGALAGKHIETIDMAQFASGQYLIVFSFDETVSTQTIIKK